MMRGSILIAGLFALTGCDRIPGTAAHEEATQISAAQKLVLTSLADPESAQFGETTRNPANGVVCGAMNAKNRMGGYVGFTPFYVVSGIVRFPPNPDALLLSEFDRKQHDWDSKGFANMWDTLCLKQPASRP